MEELDDIYKNVCAIIENSVGVPKETIRMEDTLFDILGIDSIDMVDILYELETLYGMELKISDIEARAKLELGETPYEINGVITPEGLVVLKKYMTEIDPAEIVEGLTVHHLVKLFSVHSLCKIVQFRLEQKKLQAQ
jgi:acyl carrier protein